MAGWGYYDGGGWPAYVPVAAKIANAKRAAAKLRKKGVDIQPVEIAGRKIAASFWGKAWCDHMESYNDFENRLPRGRSYVRNGSVVHLEITRGLVKALVAGSETYSVEIRIDLLPRPDWEAMKKKCAGQISSLLDLLKGKLSDGVMRIVTDKDNGLFPGPDEFRMKCSCPDYAYMCKHIAAVLYGIGARLDARPELLFLLRGVDHAELAVDGGVDAVIARGEADGEQLGGADLSEMFGIDLLSSDEADPSPEPTAQTVKATSSRKPGATPSAGTKATEKGKRPAVAGKAKAPQRSTKKAKDAAKRAETKSASARQGKPAAAVAPKSQNPKAAVIERKPAKPRAGRKAAATRDMNRERLDKAVKMAEERAKTPKKARPGKKKP